MKLTNVDIANELIEMEGVRAKTNYHDVLLMIDNQRDDTNLRHTTFSECEKTMNAFKNWILTEIEEQ